MHLKDVLVRRPIPEQNLISLSHDAQCERTPVRTCLTAQIKTQFQNKLSSFPVSFQKSL